MLPLHRPLLDEITLAAAGVALIALILAIVALVQLRRLRRSFRTLDGPDGRETVLQSLGRMQQESAALRGDMALARREVAAAREDLSDALRHVAVVRYDAFGDMGGRLSFSAAWLDDAADGVVITSINGRTEGRSYAKGIKGGAGETALSPEEQEAVRLAMQDRASGEPRGRHAAAPSAASSDQG